MDKNRTRLNGVRSTKLQLSFKTNLRTQTLDLTAHCLIKQNKSPNYSLSDLTENWPERYMIFIKHVNIFVT